MYDNKFKNDWGNLGFPFFQLDEIEQPNKYEVLVPISNEFIEKNDTQFVEEKNDTNFENEIEKLERQEKNIQNVSGKILLEKGETSFTYCVEFDQS